MRKILLTCFGFSFLALGSFAQAPTISWEKSFGGTSNETAYAIKRTSTGGYAIAGDAASQDGNVTGGHGQSDFWLVSTDSTGAFSWAMAYGGSGAEGASTLTEDAQGNFVIAGATTSSDGNFTVNQGGGGDFGIVKVSSTGTVLWDTTFGGSGYDYPSAVHATPDGGYIVAGYSDSNNGDVTNTNGGSEFWVVKLSAAGTISWQKSYGGTDGEYANDIALTADGGYIVAGTAISNNGDVSGNHGGQDAWVVKLNSLGSLIWQKALGGTLDDRAYSIKELSTGGYIMVGFAKSSDGDATANHGGNDLWVVKLDATGTLVWQKSLGGTADDNGSEVLETADGGFYIAGTTSSNDGDVFGNHGSSDIWALKLDATGTLLWQKCLGGSSPDGVNGSTTSAGGKFVVAGFVNSTDGDVTANHSGQADFWAVKLGGVPTEIAESSVRGDISIYPNPSSTDITVQILPQMTGAKYTLLDGMGRELMTGTLHQTSTKIALDQLAAGYYVLQVKGKEMESIKLIKR
jgi:hypothetical protein